VIYNISELKPFFSDHLSNQGIGIKPKSMKSLIPCPFHDEKTPSFQVSIDHGHCYGCGWHGDIIDLEASISSRCRTRDFRAIVKDLAETYHVDIGDDSDTSSSKRIRSAKSKANNTLIHEETITEQAKLEIQKFTHEKLANYNDEQWRFNLMDSSPVYTDDPSQEWRILLQGIFPPNSTIWTGGRYDSDSSNFHLLRDIVQLDRPDDLILKASDCFALGRFQANAQARRSEYVMGCDYILIESDELIGNKADTDEERERNKRMSASMIQWLSCYDEMTLRVVYDTGGKSLHSIWDKPPDDTMELLKPFSESLGIDPQPLTNSTAPLRLPLSKHEKTGKPARLLYLNPKQF
tara:strand:- start:6224 stop:7273 length:1050 start_codon:yes stop_codon:yes gene_type:complete